LAQEAPWLQRTMGAASTEDCNAGADECDSAGASSGCSTATSLGHAASQGERARRHVVQEALRVLRQESQLRTTERTPQRSDSLDLWRSLSDTLGQLEVAVREEVEDGDAFGDADGLGITPSLPDDLGRVGNHGNSEAADLDMHLPQDEHVEEVCIYFRNRSSSSQPVHSGSTPLPTMHERNIGGAAADPTSPGNRRAVPAPTLLVREGSAGVAASTASPSMAGLAGVKVINGGNTGEAFTRTPPLTSLPSVAAMQLSTPAKGSRASRRASGGSVGPPAQVQVGQWLAHGRISPHGVAPSNSAPSVAVQIRHGVPQKGEAPLRLADAVISKADTGREADGGPWAGDRPLEDDGDTIVHAPVQCTSTPCTCNRPSLSSDDSDTEVLQESLPPRLSMGLRPSPGRGRSGRQMSQARLSELSPDWAAWSLAVHEVAAATAAAEAVHGNSCAFQQRPTLRPL